MKTVIISGGSLDYDFAKEYLKKEMPDCLIAADRGMRFCYENQIHPDYVLGDFDSTKSELITYYRQDTQVQMIEFQPEKDDTDTEIAVKKAIELGSTKIIILGALGGRMDHCLANIHVLKLALDAEIEAFLVDRQNEIRLLSQGISIKKDVQYGTYVSFLPFTDRVEGVTLTGFKYPLRNYTMEKGLSIGISNEVVEDVAKISFDKGIMIMIQSKD